MKTANIFLLLLFMLLSGCASVKVIPEQIPGGVINPKDNSQTISIDNIVITVAPADTDMVNYNIEAMVASFNIEIRNGGESEVTFDNESFILLNSDRRQFYPLTPDKVRQMMAKDTYYLLPYPYVGFYYLEDYEKAAFINSTSSNLPYYFEIRPQDLYTKALPTESIIPNASVRGLLYFHADIHSLTSFSINVYRKWTSKASPPDFVFPFKVIK